MRSRAVLAATGSVVLACLGAGLLVGGSPQLGAALAITAVSLLLWSCLLNLKRLEWLERTHHRSMRDRLASIDEGTQTVATMLRFADREHRFTDFVMGPTIVARRETAAAVRFAEARRGEDTGFLQGAAESGARISSADRFNFVQVRSGGDRHTWTVTDAELLASGEVNFYGRADTHAMI